MGKKHDELRVIRTLSSKGIKVISGSKTVGIPAGIDCGIKTLGKIDFLRFRQWKIIFNYTAEVKNKSVVKKKRRRKKTIDRMNHNRRANSA